jgi:hypothetical protein
LTTAAIGLLALIATAVPVDVMQGALIERTLAIVGGQALTLSDVQTARALKLVDTADDFDAAIERLVERALVLREVDRYAPPEPDDAAIQLQLDRVHARVPKDELERVLAAGGFTEARLRAWLRDDLRIAAYLNQRFASTGPQSRANLVADWIADLRRRTTIVELWKK